MTEAKVDLITGLTFKLTADGPAGPEGREPASVTGQPSDENCWQWYTYCPEEGLEMYPDKKQAQSAAESIMGSHEVAAYSDGWHEDMESVSWGMLVPIERAQVVERKTAGPGDEFDEWVKYKLRPARYGHQPAPPSALRTALDRLYEYAVSHPNHDTDKIVAAALAALDSPAPPAEGEVGELVKWLYDSAKEWEDLGEYSKGAKCHRAADLLAQRHPEPYLVTALGPKTAELATNVGAVYRTNDAGSSRQALVTESAERTILVPARAPVPVSERPWEREGWCDESGRCWMGDPGGGGFIPSWRLCRPEDAPNMKVSLPAHALPLPAGEPQS